MEDLTPEQIVKHYAACMDSVNLINAGKPPGISESNWAATVARNKAHLEIMVGKDFMQTQNLTPIRAVLV